MKAILLEIRTRRGIGCAGQTLDPVQRIPEAAGYEARTGLLYDIFAASKHTSKGYLVFFKLNENWLIKNSETFS